MIHSILAETNAEPPSFGATVAVCAMIGTLLIVLSNVFMAYFMKRQLDVMRKTASEPSQHEISNQPVRIQIDEELHEKFAAKEDFEAHKQDVKGEFQNHRQELKKELDRIARERSEDLRIAAVSRKTMYDKQDVLRQELTTRTDNVRDELGKRIDAIPERVIATLRNTGAIGGNKND